MIGRKAEAILNRAVRYAVEQEHEYFTLEHVLWSLLSDRQMRDTIQACGGNPLQMRNELENYLHVEIPRATKREDKDFGNFQEDLSPESLDSSVEASEEEAEEESENSHEHASRESPEDFEPDAFTDPEVDPFDHLDGTHPKDFDDSKSPAESRSGEEIGPNHDNFKKPFRTNSSKKGKKSESSQEDDEEGLEHPVATLSIQRLIQRALFHVQSSGKEEIQPLDLLIALFQAKDSVAVGILRREGIQRLDILNHAHLAHDASPQSGGRSTREADSGNPKAASSPEVDPSYPNSSAEDPLEVYAINLNEKARAGKLDPLIGRTTELERTIQILCRRRKNNPIFVGEAGVGKSALAEGLAHRIITQQVPIHLKNVVIYSLDVSSLLAGAKFRGDFEQRFKKIVQAVEEHQARGQRPIFFIDEVHTLVGAGSVGGGSLDAANLLKPLLARGSLQCIGATTYSEFRRIFEKDQALARRFQKVDVPEPTFEETCQILRGILPHFAKFHEVEYHDEAVVAAVRLSSQFLADRFLPDKAIDVLDEAGAKAHLAHQPLVDQAWIEEVVAQMAKLPSRALDFNKRSKLKNLASELKMALFGQDLAIEGLVSSIHLAQAGLRNPEKPMGSFLFCGPTGVGKTELSKQLAHCLGVPLLRFDMSEYQEKHSLSRLIGAPPGYVGFEQAGLLTESISKNPYSVVLLDEIEKAHPEIWNTFLQVMDHGSLTDNNGRRADFRNAVIILTSNVGSQEMQRKPLGIQKNPQILASAYKEIEKTFTPEFRNRLDQILFFNPLSNEAMEQVVSRQLAELESQLLKKSVEVQFEPSVLNYLAHQGHDPLMGARPLARLIQMEIKRPLSEEILFGSLQEGGSVRMGLSDSGKIILSVEKEGSRPGLRVHSQDTQSRSEVS